MVKKARTLKNKRILITCGPTWVPIDDMRVISNRSTGELGHRLARDLQKAGAAVTVLEGPVTCSLESKKITVKKYCFYDELWALLKSELRKKCDVVVHAAAVSDYHLRDSRTSKIRSGLKTLTLHLVPTAKMIDKIKRIAPKTLLVGFKLESYLNKSIIQRKARALVKQAQCDLMVINSFQRAYQAHIVDRDFQILARYSSRGRLSRGLTRIIENRI